MEVSDITKAVTAKADNWTIESGLIAMKRGSEKMIFNDTLTMIWLEIDGSSSAEDISSRIYEKLGGQECIEDVSAAVAEGLGILEAEGMVRLGTGCFDDWTEEDIYA